MLIPEMHVWFRQYAQQMGMQNYRAILPEQIDNFINTSTMDVVDEIVKTNVGTTNDKIITDNAKLANINALRTLYKVRVVDVKDDHPISYYSNEPYIFFSDAIGKDEALYYVDFSIKYVVAGLNDKVATRWFPIRVIDDVYLADVLNDWVLSPRMRTPVMTVYAMSSNPKEQDNIVDSTFELYFGDNNGNPNIAKNSYIYEIRISYIKKPNKVCYSSDITGDSNDDVHSDLPEQLQIPMLKHAVDLYRASIQGSLFASQNQEQEQKREIARNNARPDNEGYQS